MRTQKIIENLLEQELLGLCTNCIHAEQCSYRYATSKLIVQCEMYTVGTLSFISMPDSNSSTTINEDGLDGLCRNCARANRCQLPSRSLGAWHCEEYV